MNQTSLSRGLHAETGPNLLSDGLPAASERVAAAAAAARVALLLGICRVGGRSLCLVSARCPVKIYGEGMRAIALPFCNVVKCVAKELKQRLDVAIAEIRVMSKDVHLHLFYTSFAV